MEKLHASAHALIAVPGGESDEGPGGVLIACENSLIYKKSGQPDRKCVIPVRLDQSTKEGVFITDSQAFYNQGQGAMIFIQSEHGDLYKVDLKQEDTEVKSIHISYFDTIAPSSKIVLLASGYLFAAGDCANH